jgi:hypothetical protein
VRVCQFLRFFSPALFHVGCVCVMGLQQIVVSVLITDSACCEERDQGLGQVSPTIKVLFQL